MKIKLIVLVVSLSTGLFASGQETQTYSDAWFLLLNDYKFNKHWSAGSEIHWRCTNFLTTKEQLLIRPFLNYAPDSSKMFTLGYTYIESYPYTENAIIRAKPEHNIWEQITLSHSFNKMSFAHRFRVEHRFQGDLVQNSAGGYDVGGFSFSNRFRYRFTIKRNLGNKFFIHAFDELWIKMNDSFAYPGYDRNWLYLGLGYKVIKSGNIQLA